MGCGGSKVTTVKNAPEPVLIQIQPAAQQEVSPPKENREQPEGKITEQSAAQSQQEANNKQGGGSLTEEQISLVQDTWGVVKEALDLEQVGVEFYVR